MVALIWSAVSFVFGLVLLLILALVAVALIWGILIILGYMFKSWRDAIRNLEQRRDRSW